MRVTVVAREGSLEEIHNEQTTTDVLEAALDRPRLLWLVLHAVRQYESADQLERGRGGGSGLDRVISSQNFEKREQARAFRIKNGLAQLYRSYDPGQVRGALLEALVERQLRPRYSASGNQCDNNATLLLENGAPHTTTTSVDVFGFDGSVGECHDCKVDARKFKPTWVAELEDEVAPRGLAAGLVTADMEGNARRKLKANGITPTRATVVDAKFLWERKLPLR